MTAKSARGAAKNKLKKTGGSGRKTGADGKRKPGKKGAGATPKATGKWPHAEKSPFRPGSSYDTCYGILAAHPQGLAKQRLVELLAEATGKDLKRAAFDAQVLLSAKPNEAGLSNNDSPRHRSCRPGFYVARNGDNVTLRVD